MKKNKDIEKNFIAVQGWMVQKLNLSGNDLLLFALIYGFCQDEQSCFSGSLSYMETWLNCSKPTIIKTLKSLQEKNFIIKTSKVINYVSFNEYQINIQVVNSLCNGSKGTLQVVKNLYGGSKETLQGGSKETLHNNIYNNINNNNSNILKNITTHNSEDENLKKREICFQNLVNKELQDRTEKEEIQNFVLYWTEPNKKKSKMKFEDQKFFDIKRRFATWMRNVKTKHTNYNHQTQKNNLNENDHLEKIETLDYYQLGTYCQQHFPQWHSLLLAKTDNQTDRKEALTQIITKKI